MPSGSPGEGRFAWLRSQGLGVLCGYATVLLLGVGSVVLSATREGASANVGMDDVRAFFETPHIAHTWLYLLVPVMGLYALNTLLATAHSVAQKWRLGMRSPMHYGAAVIHLAFLLALLAHGVGGLWSTEGAPILVGPDYAPVVGGRAARLADLQVDTFPNGMPRQVRAMVELREADGSTSEVEVGYNAPLSFGFGSDLYLLATWSRSFPVVTLADEQSACRAGARALCPLDGGAVEVLAIHMKGHWGNAPAVLVRPEGSKDQPLFLLPGREERLPDGRELRLERVDVAPGVLLRERHAPGNPWALAAAATLLVGLGMLGRRWIR